MVSVCATLDKKGENSIGRRRKESKTNIPIIAHIFIVICGIICLWVCSNILFASLLFSITITDYIFKHNLTTILIKQKVHLTPVTFCIILAMTTGIVCKALAQIPGYLPNTDKLMWKTERVDQKLENIFQSYNTTSFSLEELGRRPCDIENRFTFILVNINLIEETNYNIQERYKNLSVRKKNIERNINNINKRAQTAKIDIILENVPLVSETKVKLNEPYKRMFLWGKEIDKNIRDSKCSPICAFNRIDLSSIKIVEEISRVQKEQDYVNKKLTELEKTFDLLEQKQRQKENELIVKGF